MGWAGIDLCRRREIDLKIEPIKNKHIFQVNYGVLGREKVQFL